MRKILLTLTSLIALGALVACGGSSNTTNATSVPPAPTGGNNAGFTTASLSGTYVFTESGYNSFNNVSYNVAGILTADGAGHITGTRDIMQDNGAQAQNQSLSGSYTINQDGRGQIVLTGGTAITNGPTIYRIVMESPSTAKLFEISNTSDGTGKLQLQSNLSATFPGTTYILTLSGEDANANRYPYGAIGGLTFAASGAITGSIDENDAGDVDHGTEAPLAANGTYTLAANGRGTATLTIPGAIYTGTHHFIVYEVSPARLEFISTDANFFLSGYASPQTSAVASTGLQIFSISGSDNNGNPIVETGSFTITGNAIASGIEDYNDAGVYNAISAITGTYATTGSGRWTSSLGTVSAALIGWQVSPQLSVVLTNSSTILETGVMRAQTAAVTTANVTGDFADNLSGVNIASGNVEITGNSSIANGSLITTFDSQTASGDFTNQPTTADAYSTTANGRGTGTLFGLPVVMYTVDANTIYVISADPTRIYQGKMVSQNATTPLP